jgi:MFS superfamily sulfate permease-like transporter
VLGRVGGFHGPTVAVGAARVAVVGDIPSGLPAVKLPDAGLGDGPTLLPAALGIFFVSQLRRDPDRDRLFFANAGDVTGRIHEAVDGNPTRCAGWCSTARPWPISTPPAPSAT